LHAICSDDDNEPCASCRDTAYEQMVALAEQVR